MDFSFINLLFSEKISPFFRRKKYFFPLQFHLILFCLVSWSPETLDDLRREGTTEMQKLTEALKNIQSKEDVKKESKQLVKRFNRIADLLIETRKFRATGAEPSAAGDELFAELSRLYEIPGVREAIEATQREAIRRLDRTGPRSMR
jgi:hypothetical protein